jgi:thiamine-monophosphate kinase
MTRRGARPGDHIYMTGRVGAGNLMAARTLFEAHLSGSDAHAMPGIRLPLRTAEARLIRDHATCCIDTSDGVLNALNVLADTNGTGYLVHDIPYRKDGLRICSMIDRPGTFLFAGECGEYELLFTVSPDREKEFLQEAGKANLQFAYLGRMTEVPDRLLREDGKMLKFNNFDISARGFNHIEDYLKELTNYIRNATGPE